jgi:hypothetical protein
LENLGEAKVIGDGEGERVVFIFSSKIHRHVHTNIVLSYVFCCESHTICIFSFFFGTLAKTHNMYVLLQNKINVIFLTKINNK